LLTICCAPSLSDSFIFLTLTRLVVVLKFINFRFTLFTPPLGDFHPRTPPTTCAPALVSYQRGREREKLGEEEDRQRNRVFLDNWNLYYSLGVMYR
jgi:hypothetical protein